MFAKVVISIVLVSILPCESRQQKFFEVPFDDDTTTPIPHQFLTQAPQIQRNFDQTAHTAQHFASNQQQFHGNFHNQAVHNNPIFTNSRVQASEEDLRQNAALRAQLDIDRSSFHGHLQSGLANVNQVSGSIQNAAPQQAFPNRQLRGRVQPSSNSFTRTQLQQPIQSFDYEEAPAQPIRSRLSHLTEFDAVPQFGSSVNSDYEQLNTPAPRHTPAPLQTPKPPVNAFFGIEEPTLTFVGQKPSEDESNNAAHFIRRTQPAAVLTPIPQPQQVFSSQIPQLQRPQPAAVRTPNPPQPQQLFHSQIPQLHRPEPSLNQRFTEQPDYLINLQPTTPPAPARFFVNHKVPRNHQQVLQRPNTNIERPQQRAQDREEEIFKQQAQSAKYSFASQIDDSINGNQHQREEVRDGLSVKGMYSYSDGYVKRTVFYEADEKGYRVVKEEEEPLGNGPQVNPNGQANVSSYVAGNAVQYSITNDDIQQIKENEPQQKQQNF